MITKYALAEQVLRILQGGDVSKDADLQIREIMLAVGQARDMLVRRELYQSMTQGEHSIPAQYLSEYRDVEVKSDDERGGMVYSELPSQYLDLPQNMGVYSVSLMKDPFNAFVPVNPGFMSLYNNLPSQNLEGKIGYMPKGDRVYYTNLNCNTGIDKVFMCLVSASSEFGEDDDFPIPPDKEMEVIQLALQLYAPHVERPSDTINDNVDLL